MKKMLFLLTLLITTGYMTNAQELIIHPVPNEIIYTNHNDDFTVQVRIPGQDWQDLYEYNVIVDMDSPQPASMVQFDFSGKVEMKVKVNNGPLNSVKIRPSIQNIRHTVNGKTIYFSLDKPSKLSLEINEDKLHNLHIFANAPETEKPNPNDPNVIYYEAGVHKPMDVPGNAIRIPSGKTVYLAPGSIIQGKFVCDKVENVRFIGRGIIDQPERGFEFTHSKNIEIDGITVINPIHYTVYGGETDGIKINNLKSFSCRGWSDGIDLMSCTDVDINDIFMRNSDDCIAIYAHRWNFFGDVRNYSVKNAILWADVAHPINIGLHGDTEGEGEIIENLHFSNIDILEHDEDDRDYQGCLALSVSDKNFVRNIVFEDIRIDNFQEGQLFNLRVLFNEKYSKAPGKGIQNILFKNIYYTGYDENPSIIEGFNEKFNIENIRFENIMINGKKAKTLEDAGIKIGKYTNNITLK